MREAVILASILSRCSIPVLHSSAAMLKIAEMPYSGPNSIFLRVLLNKKVGHSLWRRTPQNAKPPNVGSTHVLPPFFSSTRCPTV